MTLLSIRNEVRVADEVFIATALLHRENPDKPDFTINEIIERAEKEKLTEERRPGLRVHVYSHCVANLPPNTGRYRMLYATGRSTRRLLLSGDDVDSRRTGKIFPDPSEVPPRYHQLIDWAKRRYEQVGGKRSKWLESILKMRGMGADLWRDEDPDKYVRELRKGWE